VSEKYAVAPRTWTTIGDTAVGVHYTGPDGDQVVTTDAKGAILLPAATEQELQDPWGYWSVRPGNVPVRRDGDDEPKELAGFTIDRGKWAPTEPVTYVEPVAEAPTVKGPSPKASDIALEKFEEAQDKARSDSVKA
jgi:hypothetical protein